MEFENNNNDNNISKVVTKTTKKNVVINDIDNSHPIIEINSVMIPEIIKQETTTITTTTTIKKKKRRRRKNDTTEQDDENTGEINEFCDISFTSVYSTTSSISSISNDFYSTSLLSNSSLEEIPLNYHPYNSSHKNLLFLNDIQTPANGNNTEVELNNIKGKEKEVDITNVSEGFTNNIKKIKQNHLSFCEDASSKNTFNNTHNNIISTKINISKSHLTESNSNISKYNSSTCSLINTSNSNIIENKFKEKDDNIKLKRKSNISEVNIKYFEKNGIPYNRLSLTEENFCFNNVSDFNSINFIKENHITNLNNDNNSFYSFTQSQSSPIKKIGNYKTYSKSVIQKETLKNDIKCQNPYYLNNKDINDIYSIMNLNAKINLNKHNHNIKNLLLGNISLENVDNSESFDGKCSVEEENKTPSFGFIQRIGYTRPEGLEPWIEKSDFNLKKEKCSICFEDFKAEASIPFMLICQHYFHFECIFKWCCQEDNSKCPLCRETIDKNRIFDDIVFEFDNMDEKDLCYSTILPELKQEISTTSTTTLTHSQTKTTQSTTSTNRYPLNEHKFTSPINVMKPSSASSTHSPIYSTRSSSSYHRRDDKICTPVKEVFNQPPSIIRCYNDNDNKYINHPSSYSNLNDKASTSYSTNNNNGTSLYNSNTNPKSPESKSSLSNISVINNHDPVNNSPYHTSSLNRHSFISLQNINNPSKTDESFALKKKNSSLKNSVHMNLNNTSTSSYSSSLPVVVNNSDVIIDTDTADITLNNTSLTNITENNTCVTANDNTLKKTNKNILY
ncbi:hypothetical protein PIROE2DRAFT_7451 [Piromyces sp. E2]|nr:hypothetical protein PIROE2DRAFT_7451 [Piromyces sp. E2]|eukprot:OUM65520.1 hypothetical protein PIROE2DRAFT_7451 [Piromyces sp. E2]